MKPVRLQTALRSSLMVLMISLLSIINIGCATLPAAHVTEQGMPDDFSIDLTVLVRQPAAATQPPTDRPHHVRQSRYILFPSGELHYAADQQRAMHRLPPRVRVLNQQQITEVWQLAEQANLLDADAGQSPVNFKTYRPEVNHVLYLATFSVNHDRHAVIRSHRLDQPADAAMQQLIERLAALAWADEVRQAARIIPQRYDFGPDPYARYRTTSR
jgi:hypothetical protein